MAHSCDISFEEQLKYALKITKVKGNEFDLWKYDPSTYGFELNATPSEVLRPHPECCQLVHVKSCGPSDMKAFALYADGACLANYRTPQARAGVGIYGMPNAWYNQGYILPLDVTQTVQKAKIHSAIAALKVAREILQVRWKKCPEEKSKCCYSTVLLIMDSSYVVQAMSEWIRKWRANGYRNARGGRVVNREALQILDNEVRRFLEEHSVVVRFWLVPRDYNDWANYLAAEALHGYCNADLEVEDLTTSGLARASIL